MNEGMVGTGVADNESVEGNASAVQPTSDEEGAGKKIEFRKGEMFVLKGCVFRLELAKDDRIVLQFIGRAPSKVELRRAQREKESKQRNARKRERRSKR
jgi:ribosomal protein L24E